MKIVTILGTRPQFIKAAPVSKALRQAGIQESILHTGQHYDEFMSQRFFDELGLPPADINLGVGSGGHGWQTGQMLAGIETVLLAEKPDWVIVYGDTNSTLAGALAAVKLHQRVAHVEAGLRSYNRHMPEEHNRVLTDHCADLLFCPTQTAVDNLHREGITAGVHLVGDVMYDAALQFGELAREKSTILAELNLAPKTYLLATIHRAENTDDPGRLESILEALSGLEEPVIMPLHPRTQQKIVEYGLEVPERGLKLIPPVGYLDMLMLEQNARLILTDSGGVQKEAYFFRAPCLTLRNETEWPETVEAGWNRVAKVDEIVADFRSVDFPTRYFSHLFGNGNASRMISKLLIGVINENL